MDDRAFVQFLLAIVMAILLFNLAPLLLVIFTLGLAIYAIRQAE